jgi:hypothetical protein
MKSLNILLFDDVEENLREVQDLISKELGVKGKVEAYPLVRRETSKLGDPEPFEDIIERELRKRAEPVSLIVADRDLSRATDYRGLSEPTVRRAAERLAIPECGYARGESGDAISYLDIGEKREECIRLSLTPQDVFARKVVDIAEGFEWMKEQVPNVMQKMKGRQPSPAKILAELLGVPDQVEKISLFAVGDKNRLGDIPRLGKSSSDERARRLAYLLGYWLWDSVLFFPGLVVNEIAASSYLNISVEEFRKKDVASLFSAAKYLGPFSYARGPLWWRGRLDSLLGDFEDGNSLATTNLGREVAPCLCSVDPSIQAGFVCVLSNKPVSSKNSTGKLLWLPRGADLARVSRTMIDEFGPWL